MSFAGENAEKLQSLTPEDRRLVNKIVLDFQRNGLALSNEKQEKAKEIKKKIADLCIKFQHHVNEDKSELYFTKEELEGVPEPVIAGFTQKEQDGKKVYVVTMKV